jgi:hypothetical protein
MRSAVVTVMIAALTLAPATVAAAKPRKCASTEYARESGYLLYKSTNVRATKVKCSRARRLARPKPADAKTRDFRADGFRCRGTRESNRSIAFACKRKKMRVTFLWTEG